MVPASEFRFRNSRNRLHRARAHHYAFDKEWQSLVNPENTSAEIRKDKEPGWNIVSARLPPERIESIKRNQLSLILGESAYQLRAALDGLIWDTITYTQGSEPSIDAKGLSRLEFPLSPTWKASDINKDRFHGFPFPQSLIDWMKTTQPGTPDKPVGHPERGLQNTLEDLHNLARFDRHRRLRVVVAIPTTVKISLLSTEPPGCGVVDYEWLECDLFGGKYDFARVKIVGPEGILPYRIRLKNNLTFAIFAEDVPQYPGDISIGTQFFRFFGAVEQVIERFDQEFS